MIREDLYYRLIAYSKKFCANLNVNYMDVVHDIICDGGVNEQSFTSLFMQKRSEILNGFSAKTIPIGAEPYKPITIYKYCNHCQDFLPESEFYKTVGNSTMRICKTGHNQSKPKDTRKRNRTEYNKKYQSESRREIKDSYVLSLLKLSGHLASDITDEMILEKKKALYFKRMKRTRII